MDILKISINLTVVECINSNKISLRIYYNMPQYTGRDTGESFHIIPSYYMGIAVHTPRLYANIQWREYTQVYKVEIIIIMINQIDEIQIYIYIYECIYNIYAAYTWSSSAGFSLCQSLCERTCLFYIHQTASHNISPPMTVQSTA